MKKITFFTLAFVVLAYAGSVLAHHSNSMFEVATAIWVKGTVVSYEPINPHALITLEEQRGNGQAQRWTVEGPRLGRLARLNVEDDFLKVGDVIDVCGFFFRKEIRAQRRSRGVGDISTPFIHGRVLVMPDEQKWMWGPYGQLENCVSPDEWDSLARGENSLPPR